jgi:hypothetical protein
MDDTARDVSSLVFCVFNRSKLSAWNLQNWHAFVKDRIDIQSPLISSASKHVVNHLLQSSLRKSRLYACFWYNNCCNSGKCWNCWIIMFLSLDIIFMTVSWINSTIESSQIKCISMVHHYHGMLKFLGHHVFHFVSLFIHSLWIKFTIGSNQIESVWFQCSSLRSIAISGTIRFLRGCVWSDFHNRAFKSKYMKPLCGSWSRLPPARQCQKTNVWQRLFPYSHWSPKLLFPDISAEIAHFLSVMDHLVFITWLRSSLHRSMLGTSR